MAETRSEQNAEPLNQASSVAQRGLTPTSVPTAVAKTVETAQGRTTIADNVVAKIVDIAAREVDGVSSLSSSGAGAAFSNLASNLSSRVTGADQRGQNVTVEVGEREAAVDISMVVLYGYSIPQVADAVRRNIINRVGAMTGLVVKEVNISVTDLFFPDEQAKQQPTQQPRVQ